MKDKKLTKTNNSGRWQQNNVSMDSIILAQALNIRVKQMNTLAEQTTN